MSGRLLTVYLIALALLAPGAGSVSGARADALAVAGNPFLGRPMVVDEGTQAAHLAAQTTDTGERELLLRIARKPQARWVTSPEAIGAARLMVNGARHEGRLPLLVLYYIPKRDCGNHSAGGAPTAAAYRRLVDRLAVLVAGSGAAVILEPDALTVINCLTGPELRLRQSLLRYATTRLSRAGASVYIDAGHANWWPSRYLAARLLRSGIQNARGIALNVSYTSWRQAEESYARALARRLNPKLRRPLRAVIDTSRNGLGPASTWCNPPGRALGLAPRAVAADPVLDAYLWIKHPGESDGACNGGPEAGIFWPDYAFGLATRAR